MICQDRSIISKPTSNAIIFQYGYAVKRKNCVKAEDRHKVRLDNFDKSDHEQHIEKCVSGSGIYFGFRGAIEHAMLKIEDVCLGTYPKGSDFEGYQYFSVAQLVDKTHALSAENGYRRSMMIKIF